MTTKKKVVAPFIRRHSISQAALNKIGACWSQQYKFRNIFELSDRLTRIPITAENVRIARNAGLSIEWLLTRVLTRKDFNAYYAKRQRLHRRHQSSLIMTYTQLNDAHCELIAKTLREGWGKKDER